MGLVAQWSPYHPDIDPLFGVRLQLALETVAYHEGGKDGKAPVQRCSSLTIRCQALPGHLVRCLLLKHVHRRR
jgi:hypothetical protein